MMKDLTSIESPDVASDIQGGRYGACRTVPQAPRVRRDALDILKTHPELRQDQEHYNINVTSQQGTRLSAGETFDEIMLNEGANQPIHLYFHVPLCDYICKFCNYVKRLAPRNDGGAALDLWTDLLLAESSLYSARCDWLAAADVQSLYLGGGTASLLRARHLERIMTHVRAQYALREDAEISLEGNPDNFLNGEAADAVRLGFNRFSLGVQSLDDRVTTYTGRKHDAKESRRAIDKLHETGKPFNVDMMFGLPFQNVSTVIADIEELIARGVPTITIYRFRNALRHEMGIGNKSAWNNAQVIARMTDEGLFPTLTQTYAMRDAITNVFLENDYYPSPCGWWSKKGIYPGGNIPRVSRNKWQNFNTMIAYGPGAYGWLSDCRKEVIQTHNIQDIAAYLGHMRAGTGKPPLAFGRRLNPRESVATIFGFAFKANQPIEIADFAARHGVRIMEDKPYSEVVHHLIAVGFLSLSDDRRFIQPTLDGETLHEEIISHYLHGALGADDALACKR